MATTEGWDRIRGRLPVPWYASWFGQFGGWAVGGLATASLLVTLYVWYTQQQELTQLHEQIATLSRIQTPVSSAPPSRPLPKQDTVYIVKRVVVVHRYVPRTTMEPTETELTQAVQLTRPDYSVADSTQTEAVPQAASVSRLPANGNVSTPGQNTSIAHTAPLSGSKQRALPAKRRKAVTKAMGLLAPENQSVPVDVARSSTTRTPSTVLTDTTQAGAQRASSTDSIAQATPPNPTRIAKVEVQQPTEPKPANPPSAEPKAPKTASKPAFSLASLHPRLGLATQLTTAPISGFGPMAELFFSKNFSLSTGLLISKQGGDHDDYTQPNGQDFVDTYKAYLPAQYDRIEDVSIQTSLLQIPFQLTYYIPLPKSWSAFVSTGTQLDLASYQSVRYECFTQNTEHHYAFETKAANTVFHMVQVGVGMQYQYKRFIGKLSPVWQYNFRNTSYADQKNNLGIQFSLLMDLTKR